MSALIQTSSPSDSRIADRLWEDYARTHDPRTRDAIVQQFSRLAYSLANRFARRGGENEDLVQVALMGLVKAVDRFDPRTNYRFSTFATPTILGELKRYFRDHAWALHVPRGLQELAQRVDRARREWADDGANPTVAQLAASLQSSEAEVSEALQLLDQCRPLSLDGERDPTSQERSSPLEEILGGEDAELRLSEHRVSLSQALGCLRGMQAQVLRLRYYNELSQREVARRLGLSQMQVSRLERTALLALRRQFGVR